MHLRRQEVHFLTMASASNLPLPPLPPSLKPIAHLLKTASEHESRDPVVTYWCRLAALQTAMKLDKSSKEAQAVLLPVMDWLEKEKKVLADNEAVSSEVVASAHIENYAMRLFGWADREDRAGRFGKNVVKAFYTAGMLFDVLPVFGEMTPENAHARKYSKWKAAYIHNCLKNGETPIPGPAASGEEEDDELGAIGGAAAAAAPPSAPPTEAPVAAPYIPPAVATSPAPGPTPAPRATGPVPVVPDYSAEASGGGGGASLSPAEVAKAQKYCKFASSALDYDDKASAIDNLTKALRLLQTGRDS